MYTEKKKADRAAMAQQVEALVSRYHGFTLKRSEGGDYPGPRCIKFDITGPRGLWCSLDFDGNSSQPDVRVVCWGTRGHTKLAPRFEQVGGTVNPYHFGKCTAVNYGWGELIEALQLGLEMGADGSAFQD